MGVASSKAKPAKSAKAETPAPVDETPDDFGYFDGDDSDDDSDDTEDAPVKKAKKAKKAAPKRR
jgi:hypothetical protein